ncbi:MAG TPA: membrane protein insertase YidC [Spirochaetota bacterium]|nr:membrane protein insertase YidC [Spirochaetota bacterium]HPF07566.1 membrane protein insertase YidC [Spirochaetota bacterium]HPJ41622.1 membrane protein insertase YidC [Spirochaetota bacterium]HPR36707.1 membrane protein insertase YidC [Spirochaetota bacterium]HRX47118.1 membrane protein insertase YidC [Spirochaetota bacterium]
MEKRTLVAVLLTMLVWVGWFWFFVPEQEQNKQVITQEQSADSEEVKESAGAKSEAAVKTPSAVLSSVSKNLKEESILLKTGKFNFELQNKGASIKKANYTDRNIELAINEKIFNSNGTIDFAIHFSEEDFLKGNSLENELWDFQKVDDHTVKFFTDISFEGNPLRIEKTYRFTDKGYDFTVDYRFVNRGRKPFSFKNREAIFSPSDTLGPKLDYKNRNNHMMGIYSVDSDYEQNLKGGGFFSKAGEVKKKEGNVDYTGIMSRYFLLIMMPQQSAAKGMIFDNRDHHGYRTGMTVDMPDIAPGGELAKSFRIYLGEKDKEMLGAVDQKLVDASDVSTLIEPIRYFVIWALLGINKLFGNLGWSLVVFSILTKIVFMPLTKKSTDSMKKMQELAPEVKKLQAKYKDKPDVLQKETMKIYKDNKVNPMGGCLPLLLQMPFFFALYSALINSIDLWNAPFMLWMKDLSMPDTVATISGFDINILPLLMTLSTIIQQKQTMVDTGNQQQKIMMYMMPVILLFIFWTMPSGLVLYWFLQNLYQVAHQFVVNKIGKTA